jgi:hypothetical protein
MTLAHALATRTNICTTVNTDCSSGAGVPKFRVKAGADLVCEIPIGDPVFDAPAAGKMILAGLPWEGQALFTVPPEAPIDNFEIVDGDGGVRLTGSCLESGGNATISDATPNIDDYVTVIFFSYDAAP